MNSFYYAYIQFSQYVVRNIEERGSVSEVQFDNPDMFGWKAKILSQLGGGTDGGDFCTSNGFNQRMPHI